MNSWWIIQMAFDLALKAGPSEWRELLEGRVDPNTGHFELRPFDMGCCRWSIDDQHRRVRISGVVTDPVFVWHFLDLLENLLDCKAVRMIVWTEEGIPISGYEWVRNRNGDTIAERTIGLDGMAAVALACGDSRSAVGMLLLNRAKPVLYQDEQIRELEADAGRRLARDGAAARRCGKRWNARKEKPIGRTCFDVLGGMDACLAEVGAFQEVMA